MATPGNGLLLFFRVDDFDMALKRARDLVARLEEEPNANPNTKTQEFSLRGSGRILRHHQCVLFARAGGRRATIRGNEVMEQPRSLNRTKGLAGSCVLTYRSSVTQAPFVSCLPPQLKFCEKKLSLSFSRL